MGSTGGLWLDTRNDVEISVWNGPEQVSTGAQSIKLADVLSDDHPASLVLPLTLETERVLALTVRVRTARGRPVADASVVAIAPGVGQLGDGTTNAVGEASLLLNAGAEGTPADSNRRVRFHVTQGSTVLVETPVVFSPVSGAVIDLVVRDETVTTASEHEVITAALTPWLAGRNVWELATDEIEVLAVEASVFPVHLAMVVQAARLAQTTSIVATTWYALLRGGLPSRLSTLLVQKREHYARALRRAYHEGLVPVPPNIETAIEARIAELRALTVSTTLTPPPGSDVRIQQALATTSLSGSTRQAFVARFIDHAGSLPSLWRALGDDPSFTEADVATLEFTITAAGIVNHHLPTLTVLQAARNGSEIGTVQDLAAWDADRLEQELLAASVVVPEDIPGETAAERRRNFVEAIERILEDLHPTASLRARLARDELPAAEGVDGFLGDNPDVSITSTILPRYLDEHPEAAPEGPAGEATLARVYAVQRLYNVTPRLQRYDVTRALLGTGLTSAAEIVHYGKVGFVSTFASQLADVHPHLSGTELAEAIFGNATFVNAATKALAMSYATAANDVGFAVSPSNEVSQIQGPGTATLRALFDSLDYCTCEECRSMWGPAAYLVDLLAFLEGHPAVAPGQNGLDVLRARRPDLTGIELSCINTTASLPYIDLVLEILEQMAITENATLAPRQTTWTAAELRLAPEHSLPAAYVGPANAVFPWRLPVDLPNESVRAYLRQLGVPRVQLLQTLQLPGGTPAPSNAAIVSEALGVSRRELQLISGGTAFLDDPSVPNADIYAAWGFEEEDFEDEEELVTQLANNVGGTLARASLTFDELESLLELPYIDPSGTIAIVFVEPSCNLEDARIEVLTSAAADRIHRFVRLWRRTGLDPWLLDRAIRVLGSGVLDFAFLERLAGWFDVGRRLSGPLEALLGLWAPLDTRGHDDVLSPYHRLFQNRQITRELDPAFAVVSGANELTTVVPLAAGHSETIRAAIGIGAAELERLVAAVLPETPSLNLANLSTLYRHALLARALRLRIEDLLRIRSFVTADPFSTPASTLSFLDEVDRIRRSRVSPEVLDFVLRHQGNPEAAVFPSAAAIETTLDGIVTSAAAVEVTLAAVTGEPLERLRAFLPTLLDPPSDLDAWLNILARPTIVFGEPEDEDEDYVLLSRGFARFTDDPDGAITGLVAALQAERAGFVLALVETHLRRTGRTEAIVQLLAAFSGLSAEAIVVLAGQLLHVEGNPILQVLRDETFLDGTGNRVPQRDALARLHKAAAVVTGLAVPAEHLDWYFATGTPEPAQALNLDALPFTPQLSGADAYGGWRRVQLGLELLADTTGDHPFRAASSAVDLPTALDILASRTRWDRDDLEFFANQGFEAALVPADFANPDTLARLKAAFDLVPRTGVRLAVLTAWARTIPVATQADDILRSLRSRYSDDQWPGVITPIADRLREQKRDALLDFIIARDDDFDSPQDLYDHVLVDPLTNAIVQTSRIRLAVSAVQLFIMRALMNLEQEEFRLPPEAAEQWTWMKNYSVWASNRMVFFYPENWVEPELRDDKTPFFVELEQELGQAELTDATVEQGLRTYLRKLHEVGHLETVALFREVKDSRLGGEIVHVLSRTHGLPHKYFYRTRIDDRVWTPWVAVPVDIQGDQVTIAIYNRRLFVFWAEIREETVEEPFEGSQSADEAVQKTKPPHYQYRARIGWTEFRDGRWAPKKLTTESSAFEKDKHKKDLPGFLIRARIVGSLLFSSLRIDIIRHIEPHTDPGGFVAADVVPIEINRYCVRYTYDDCRDELDELDGDEDDPVNGDLGMGYEVSTNAQFHVSEPNDQVFDVLVHFVPDFPVPIVLTPDEEDYVHFPLLHNLPTRYRVTVARQRRIYAGDTPIVFDDPDHAFYIAPVVLWDHIVDIVTRPEPLPPQPASNTWSGVLPGSSGLTTDALYGAELEALPDPLMSGSEAWSGSDALALVEQIAQIVTGSTSATISPASTQVSETWRPRLGWRIDPFHHPYSCTLLATLNRYGVEGLYTRTDRQLASRTIVDLDSTDLARKYRPTEHVSPPNSLDDYDFTTGGAYSVYNWELFFHVPLYLAEKLRKEQRFAEALRWYHFVFNPLAGVTDETPGIERFWNIKPFFLEAQGGALDVIRAIFQDEGLLASDTVLKGFADSVAAWLDDPFSPHAIARVRPGTYQKVVVRKYLDNLIDWGDSLFRQDTIESINEATQLYLLAAAILGLRPRRLSAIDPPVRTYDELLAPFLFGGLTTLENFVIDQLAASGPSLGATPPPPVWWYFCLPPNAQLLRYWDTIADRLFKIRNSQNIDGVTRTLALFEPPIDPALLVRARAQGVDIGAAIAGLNAPLPIYRYGVLVRRALELVGDLKALGSALLSALERKDAEALSLLRSQHEIAVLTAQRVVREDQTKEAAEALASLEAQKATTKARHDYYDSRQKHSPLEKSAMSLSGVAAGFSIASQVIRTLAGTLHLIPNIDAGATGYLPTLRAVWGGNHLGAAIEAHAGSLDIFAALARYGSDLTSTLAGYERRSDDWKFQAGQANLELTQLDKQIAAATIRKQITERELTLHEQQIEQSKIVDAFMRTKFTNEALFDWMIGQTGAVYFQAYKLAFDLAKKAERALQFELGRDDLTFIEFGAWDSLKKGLLAGERLGQALRRMDAAYLDNDKRYPELTRRFSLREIDADALIALRETGSCEFWLPEELFDLDHPGHYFRRIKAVSVSLPATVGPHTSVGGKLTLLADWIRHSTDVAGGYAASPGEDPRFVRGPGGVQSIATSRSRDDAGVFQLDFRDERYLPFEGAGAISRWGFELPAVRQFDYRTISDLEIQLQYTARDGGENFPAAATAAVETAISDTFDAFNDFGLILLLTARADFAGAWERFLHPIEGEQDEPLPLPIVLERFPYVARARGIVVDEVELVWIGPASAITTPSTATLAGPVSLNVQFSAPPSPPGGLVRGAVTIGEPGITLEASGPTWDLSPAEGAITSPDAIDDLLVIVRYHTES